MTRPLASPLGNRKIRLIWSELPWTRTGTGVARSLGRPGTLEVMFERDFYLLAQECHLAKAALLGGLTAFSHIDVDNVGTLYSAFFQTSVGLERLMKIAVVVDHKVKHDLHPPSNKQLRVFKHDLLVLYGECAVIAAGRSLDSAEWFHADTVEREMLAFLSSFAKRSRYYNLDVISGATSAIDPLGEWIRLHQRIAKKYIGCTFREGLNEKAIQFSDLMDARGWERWVDGQYISNVDAVYLHSFLQAANPYCVWTLLRLLKPFYKLLDVLCSQAHEIEVDYGIDHPTVPYATEFSSFFLASLKNVKRRKNWTKIFL